MNPEAPPCNTPSAASGVRLTVSGKRDKLNRAPVGSVTIEGYLGERLYACIANGVMAQNVEPLIRPFALRNEGEENGFRCEYWGKWSTAAVLAYAHEPSEDHRAILDAAMAGLLDTQAEDGHIGSYAGETQFGTWDVWGRKYVLLGLLAYYDLTGDADVLAAACLQADQTINEIKGRKINLAETGWPDWQGLPPSSILEPIAILYMRTGHVRYLRFAEEIVANWRRPNKLSATPLALVDRAKQGEDVAAISAPRPKAYEMMSCFEGLCELYRATGNEDYLAAATKAARNIVDLERMVTGTASNQEMWCHGALLQTEVLEQPGETCVTATWLKFCEQLLRLTGDSTWADEMELTLYNALLGSLTPDGSWWSYYSPLNGERVPSACQQADAGLSCCVASGPRALLLTSRWAVMTSPGVITINLYAPSKSEVTLEDGTLVVVEQVTSYPFSGVVEITVSPAAPCKFTLCLRIPEWSRQTVLNAMGVQVSCTPGSYAQVTRAWEVGDTVTLELDMRARAIHAPSGAPEYAILRGPIVLALDNRFTRKLCKAVRIPIDGGGVVDLKPASPRPEGVQMAFTVKAQVTPMHCFDHHTEELVLCDFASAGNMWTSSNLYRTWLPKPLFLQHAFVADTWRLMYYDKASRPEIPDRMAPDAVVHEHNEWRGTGIL